MNRALFGTIITQCHTHFSRSTTNLFVTRVFDFPVTLCSHTLTPTLAQPKDRYPRTATFSRINGYVYTRERVCASVSTRFYGCVTVGCPVCACVRAWKLVEKHWSSLVGGELGAAKPTPGHNLSLTLPTFTDLQPSGTRCPSPCLPWPPSMWTKTHSLTPLCA